MDARFDGKVALVTGAARAPGMGRALALRLARGGADVACLDVPAGGPPDDSTTVVAGALDALADEVRALGRRSLALEVDPGDAAAVSGAVDTVVAELGRIDVCAHFAGGTGPGLGTGPLLDIDEDGWDRCLDVNLVAPWIVARACAEVMIRQGDGGSIVVLSSFAARSSPEGYGAFSAARAGVVRLAEVLALELAGSGIRVNTVLPLGVAPDRHGNPGLRGLAERDDGDLDAWVRRHVPLGRLQEADEVASVAAFLCSDDASFVSGQAISISGGAVR